MRASLLIALLIVAVALASCTKKNPTAPKDNGNGVPQGVARVTGTVNDASGAALADVALHIVYDFAGPASSPGDVQVTSSVAFYDTAQVLTTECGGSTPLPDGVMVRIFWDSTGHGPLPTDPQPRLCAEPPDCPDQTPFTVNMIEFPINSLEAGTPPGTFFMWSRNFATNGDILTPNRFYGRIYCADGHVLYESDVIDVPQGASERPMHFNCTPCSGGTGVPFWGLAQAYPNPATDSVTVAYNLAETAHALLRLTWPGSVRTDSLVYASYASGPQNLVFRLGTRPNGLYSLRYTAGSFDSTVTLLRNVTDPNALRNMDAMTRSGGDGTFTLDAVAGALIHQRDAHNADAGPAALTSMRVVAVKSGYQFADTTFGIVGQQVYNLNLTLRPQ